MRGLCPRDGIKCGKDTCAQGCYCWYGRTLPQQALPRRFGTAPTPKSEFFTFPPGARAHPVKPLPCPFHEPPVAEPVHLSIVWDTYSSPPPARHLKAGRRSYARASSQDGPCSLSLSCFRALLRSSCFTQPGFQFKRDRAMWCC